jgi:methionine synthase II (cobalamin-independent)
MTEPFQANALPALIGSLPLGDHEAAVDMVLTYTPQIPLWVQLPVYAEEGMVRQFLPGLPGLVYEGDKYYIDTAGADFEDNMLQFYEEYMAVTEGGMNPDGSRFTLKADTARGFFVFKDRIARADPPPTALKGQVTGPITFGTSVKDQNGRAIYYDEQLRDVQVKLLALKARWQIRQLSQFGKPVIVFIDEPALAGFGSSEFISMSREEVSACLNEVIDAIHQEGGLAGIHVCANADWSLILESEVDIVNFDAYAYFDRFVIYDQALKAFLEKGNIVAWGLVPTLEPDDIEKEETGSLLEGWEERAAALEKLGIDRHRIMTQSLITPACGTGSLSVEHAEKVLRMTREVSDALRENHGLR